jgi:hypothetical protein
MYLRTCKSFKSANDKKDWISKSQIRKVSHLRKVRKSNKLFKSANLRICRTYLRNRPHLVTKRDLRGALGQDFNLRHVLQEASKVPVHLLLRELRSSDGQTP